VFFGGSPDIFGWFLNACSARLDEGKGTKFWRKSRQKKKMQNMAIRQPNLSEVPFRASGQFSACFLLFMNGAYFAALERTKQAGFTHKSAYGKTRICLSHLMFLNTYRPLFIRTGG
jgi:hypothetical protein